MRPHALRRDIFRRIDLEAERVAVERERRGEVFHGDADMIQSRSHINNGLSRRHEGHEEHEAILVEDVVFVTFALFVPS
jgi:hypothetical protein